MSKAVVVVPTYNERENIGPLVEALVGQTPPLDVIVVDDDSPDGTGSVADRVASRCSQVRVLHRRNSRGRAGAGVLGFQEALKRRDTEWIVEMDADFSHDPSSVPDLIRAAGAGADLVIGSRYVAGGKQVDCSRSSLLLSRLINWLNRRLFDLEPKDTSGGFRCYRRQVLESIDLDHRVSRHFSGSVELLLKCRRHGFRIQEIPITFNNRKRGRSKATLWVALEYLLAVIRLWWRSLRGKVV